MPTITLKNIPEQLYDTLKNTAQAHHRSMNSEILYCVEKVLGTHKFDVAEQIYAARRLRAKTSAYHISDEELNIAKNEGRA
ncbi:MAG: DNA-binding protein [Piscirickettsiaceae bacterium]|nr:MAG: DNA-binding protein [Piscirickettsiaceae bacterium]